MEATIHGGESGLSFGDFNNFVDTIAGIRTPAVGGKNIDLIAKSHRSMIVHQGSKFRNLSRETKERFIDMIVDLFSFDITADRAKAIWNGMFDLEEVGAILRSLDSEFKQFNLDQRIAIEKESISLAIDELSKVEHELEMVLTRNNTAVEEDFFVALQTVYMCRVAFAWVREHIEKKDALDKAVRRVQLLVLMSLARLDSYRRGKTQRHWIYDDLAVLSYVLRDEEPQDLLRQTGGIVHRRERSS